MSVLRMKLAGKELSAPEMLVLYAAAHGFSADETAAALIKSRHTIIAQRRSLQAKLGARNLTHAVALAYERRLFDDTSDFEQLLGLTPKHPDEAYDSDADAPSYHERD